MRRSARRTFCEGKRETVSWGRGRGREREGEGGTHTNGVIRGPKLDNERVPDISLEGVLLAGRLDRLLPRLVVAFQPPSLNDLIHHHLRLLRRGLLRDPGEEGGVLATVRGDELLRKTHQLASAPKPTKETQTYSELALAHSIRHPKERLVRPRRVALARVVLLSADRSADLVELSGGGDLLRKLHGLLLDHLNLLGRLRRALGRVLRRTRLLRDGGRRLLRGRRGLGEGGSLSHLQRVWRD